MHVNVTFRHIDPSLALKTYAEEKISRVKKYLQEPIEAHVVLKVEKFRHIAEVTIEANGHRINGAEETHDMYSAIDMLADTIEGQVAKGKDKDKIKRRKPSGISKEFVASANALDSRDFDDEEETRVIRVEQVYAKPMDLDEAVMQLNLSSDEFMVFTNRHTNRINVLYRRKDGNLGLIETIA
jgi:putative sigma-54 modulation protein